MGNVKDGSVSDGCSNLGVLADTKIDCEEKINTVHTATLPTIPSISRIPLLTIIWLPLPFLRFLHYSPMQGGILEKYGVEFYKSYDILHAFYAIAQGKSAIRWGISNLFINSVETFGT